MRLNFLWKKTLLILFFWALITSVFTGPCWILSSNYCLSSVISSSSESELMLASSLGNNRLVNCYIVSNLDNVYSTSYFGSVSVDVTAACWYDGYWSPIPISTTFNVSDFIICIVFNLECILSAFPSDYLLFLNVSGCANNYSFRKGLCILIKSLEGL